MGAVRTEQEHFNSIKQIAAPAKAKVGPESFLAPAPRDGFGPSTRHDHSHRHEESGYASESSSYPFLSVAQPLPPGSGFPGGFSASVGQTAGAVPADSSYESPKGMPVPVVAKKSVERKAAAGIPADNHQIELQDMTGSEEPEGQANSDIESHTSNSDPGVQAPSLFRISESDI